MMNTQDEIRRIESRPHKVTIEGRDAHHHICGGY